MLHLSKVQDPNLFNLVAIAKRSHPFPSRTRQLSSLASMVLHGWLCGRVERCQINLLKSPDMSLRLSGLFAFVHSQVAYQASKKTMHYLPFGGNASIGISAKCRFKHIWTQKMQSFSLINLLAGECRLVKPRLFCQKGLYLTGFTIFLKIDSTVAHICATML